MGRKYPPMVKWMAYRSDESGRHEVYVRRFPDIDNGKWTISTSGGHHPVWSPDGRELFYAMGTALYRVAINTRNNSFVARTPEMLFSGPFDLLTAEYDVMPDGQHFVMVEADPSARPTQIQVILNWSDELTRLVTSGPQQRRISRRPSQPLLEIDPANRISPVGADRPPGGSSVTATVTAPAARPGGGGAIGMPRPLPCSPRRPALTGMLPPITHTCASRVRGSRVATSQRPVASAISPISARRSRSASAGMSATPVISSG
jgi:hypothetical protein